MQGTGYFNQQAMHHEWRDAIDGQQHRQWAKQERHDLHDQKALRRPRHAD